jgi:hypothetical protein
MNASNQRTAMTGGTATSTDAVTATDTVWTVPSPTWSSARSPRGATKRAASHTSRPSFHQSDGIPLAGGVAGVPVYVVIGPLAESLVISTGPTDDAVPEAPICTTWTPVKPR